MKSYRLNNFKNMFFYFLLFLLFLSDIFVSDKIPQLSFYLVLIFPILLFLIKFWKKEKVILPKISIFFLLFLVFSAISVFFAIEKQVSFETNLVYISAFFILIYSFNNKKEVKKHLPLFIICSSVIFASTFIVDKIFNLNLFAISSSLLYSGYYHIQIGNFIALGVLTSLIYFPYIFLPLLFLTLFSYSRSAYLSLILTLPFFVRKKTWLFFMGILLLLLFLFVTSGVTFKQSKPMSYLKNFFVEKLSLSKEKKGIDNRYTYFSYAISSLKEKPFFGVGPDNFYFAASKRQLYYNENTTTGHNILLDIFTENGVVAGIAFLLFFMAILLKAKRNNDFFLFLFLSLVFLFDFSYRFNSFLALWFVLAGLLIKDIYGQVFDKSIFLAFLFIICQPIIIGTILFNIKYYQTALLVYPLRKETYYRLIESEINKGNKKNTLKFLTNLNKISEESSIVNFEEAQYYDVLGYKEKAVYFYEKRISLYPFSLVLNQDSLNRILTLNINLYGRYLGAKRTAAFLNNLLTHISQENKDSPIIYYIEKFCETNDFKCYNY